MKSLNCPHDVLTLGAYCGTCGAKVEPPRCECGQVKWDGENYCTGCGKPHDKS